MIRIWLAFAYHFCIIVINRLCSYTDMLIKNLITGEAATQAAVRDLIAVFTFVRTAVTNVWFNMADNYKL